MKIRVIGGGPGGLYFALLTKKAQPSWDIQVFERNPEGSTFGWGVVFSDETLGGFEQADAESYRAICESFVHWSDIDVHAKGELIRSTGHGFCGIARQGLLNILQQRCRELGVALHFEHECEGPQAFPDADLIVAADGINSKTRTQLADTFRPALTPGRARFIWLGTDQLFKAFTFIFRENRHGTFQVHAYPFSRTRSTFIVETDPETFQRAGLGERSVEDSLRYLEELFAPELGGASLLSNRSEWIHFREVRNERWHAGNVVLIGDAAHTAHFSIGSGTKLAMEDAIALSESVLEGGDVPEALARYQQVRWTDAAKLQKTARTSCTWFEDVKPLHAALPPLQLVMSLMTRSKRVTHQNLAARDPALVARADRWFAEQAGAPADPPPPPMFTPLSVRGLTLPNRVVVSPMCQYSAVDGAVNDWHLVHLGSRALGGAGLVMTEMTDVTPEGRITLGCAGLYEDAHEQAYKRIVDFVHGQSAAKIGVQLGHAGRKGSADLPWRGGRPLERGGWTCLAPSALPYDEGWPAPREMDRADMDHVRDAFVRAAERAARCGFDLLELHMAHGYLLSSFISPLTNRREDAYGGDLHGRMRFPLEVLDAVRAVWPEERPLSVRISASDWARGGLDIEQAVEVSALLKEHRADLIDVSSGQTTPQAQPVYGRMYQAHFSNRIRNEVGIPTIAVGAIQSWDHVNTLLVSGRADLCALARPHLADPYFTLHAAREQGFDVPWPAPYLPAKG